MGSNLGLIWPYWASRPFFHSTAAENAIGFGFNRGSLGFNRVLRYPIISCSKVRNQTPCAWKLLMNFLSLQSMLVGVLLILTFASDWVFRVILVECMALVAVLAFFATGGVTIELVLTLFKVGFLRDVDESRFLMAVTGVLVLLVGIEVGCT